MRRRRVIAQVLGTAVLTGVLWGTAPFVAAGGGGCMHGTPATDGGGTTVEMVDSCFTPTVLHASSGDTITFVNREATAHTVTGVGSTWGTLDDIDQGSEVAYTFDRNGVYVYVCYLHMGMAGAIVVGDGRGSAGLEPASVQPAEAAAAPPMVAATEPAVASGRGIGPAATLALLGAAAVGLGIGALAIVRRRRAALPRLSADAP